MAASNFSDSRESMKGISHADRNAAIAASVSNKDFPVDTKRFVEAYYAQVAAEDLAGDPRMLAAAALGHLEFGRGRRPGNVKIRAFNPTLLDIPAHDRRDGQ